MARNQPHDFSDDDSAHISRGSGRGGSPFSSSSEAHGSAGADGPTGADAEQIGFELADIDESMISDSSGAGRRSSGRPPTRSPAPKAARAAPKSARKSSPEARSGSERHDSPTSMTKKRGNQPR